MNVAAAAVLAGDCVKTRCVAVDGFTVSDDVAVSPQNVAVTVCAPATVALHEFVVHEPSGLIAKDVDAVTSPNELFDTSNAVVVYACEPPAVIVLEVGEIVM